MIAQQRPLVEHWRRVLGTLEAAYTDAQGSDAAEPWRVAQLEGMIAAYQQIIRDATP